MRIPFVGPSYQARSIHADAQRSLNSYLELDATSERAPLALYGRPGLSLVTTIGSGPIRGSIGFKGYGMFVSGNQVHLATWNGTTLTWSQLTGTLGTSSGNVGMAYDGANVIIVDGSKGYLADLTTVSEIVDADFPDGVTQATSQDGYFIVTGDGTGKFYMDFAVQGGTNWNALDFASAEGSPDDTTACLSDHRELWLFGAHSAEVWINTGNADFPFERSTNAYMQIGCAAAWSVKGLDNTIYWLGRDTNGHGVVYKSQGYSPVRISTHAVEHALQGYSRLDDAVAYTFQMGGHAFYVLNFPTAGKTWAYDAATGQWFEWCYLSGSTEQRWRPNCHAFVGVKNLVGDYSNGKIYELGLSTYTDAGDPIKFLRATQCMDSPDGTRNFYEELVVDMETGSATGTVNIRYSNDGGNTWSTSRSIAVTSGDYDTRVKIGPTGAGRNRVWEVSSTSAMKWAIVGAKLRMRKA